MRASRKQVAIALALVVVVVVGGATAYFFYSRPPEQTYVATVLTGFAVPSGKDAIFYTAVDKGFYARAGISITMVKGTGYLLTAQAVDRGTYTFGISDIPSLITVNKDEIRLKSIGLINDLSTFSFVSLKEKGIQRPQDMEGKSYASRTGMATTVVAPVFFELNKVDASKVKAVDLSPELHVPSVVQGKVDFIVAFEDVLLPIAKAVATAAGKELNVIRAKDWNMDVYGATLVASAKTIKENPEMVRRFLKGTYEALKYVDQNRDEATVILLKNYPELNRNVIRSQLDVVMNLIKSDTALKNGYGWHSEEKMAFSLATFAKAYGTTFTGTTKDFYVNELLTRIIP